MVILLAQTHQKAQLSLQKSHHSLYTHIHIPNILFSSHQSILGLIPFESSYIAPGVKPFYFALLIYAQVQHYNIHLNKILAMQTSTQNQINSDDKQQQKSEDALSVGSSINIRERKVSFGVLNYKNDQNNKKKPKKIDNLWMVQTDDQKIQQVLETQKQIHSVVKKLKILAYEYACKKDQLRPNQKPIYSVLVHKAFDLLFPKPQKQFTDLFLYQKGNLHSIFEFLTSYRKGSSKEDDIYSKSISVLIEVLESALVDKILTLSKNESDQGSNLTKDQKFVRNITKLMEYFGFSSGNDFRLISSTDQDNSEGKKQINSDQKLIQKATENYSSTGFEFQDDFFKTFFTQSGYLVSINFQSLQNLNYQVKNQFLKNLANQESRQHHPQSSINQQKNPQGSVLTWQQTHFHFVTPTNFISRYNNRYFKNQRLIYKQKSKLQSRFKEQDVQDLIPVDNYEGGFQILISSREKNNNLGELKNVHSNNPFEQNSQLPYLSEEYINPHLQHTFSPKKNNQEIDFRESYKDKFLQQNEVRFYVEEQEEIIEVQDPQRNNHENYPVRKRISREEEIDRLYKRVDFQISDNEILDDIERVLI